MRVVSDIIKVINFYKNDCRGVAPGVVKRRMINRYIRETGCNTFVETGTYLGDTLDYISKRNINVQCYSIELSEHYYIKAQKRFIHRANVSLIHGDSGECISKIVRGLNSSALFWLDGHYSAGNTARGSKDTPIEMELKVLMESPFANILLIDDARLFIGENHYPHLDEILFALRKSGRYDVGIINDIIVAIPK